MAVNKLPQLLLWAVLFFLVPAALTYAETRKGGPPWPVIVLLAGIWTLATVWFYAVAAVVLSLAVENC